MLQNKTKTRRFTRKNCCCCRGDTGGAKPAPQHQGRPTGGPLAMPRRSLRAWWPPGPGAAPSQLDDRCHWPISPHRRRTRARWPPAARSRSTTVTWPFSLATTRALSIRACTSAPAARSQSTTTRCPLLLATHSAWLCFACTSSPAAMSRPTTSRCPALPAPSRALSSSARTTAFAARSCSTTVRWPVRLASISDLLCTFAPCRHEPLHPRDAAF